ncbi:MAG: outer membrane protein transport protein [Flavobacteriales bacterium]
MKYFFTTQSPKIILAGLFICFSMLSMAQETAISPYSRLGLGDLNYSHSPAYNTMGGASVALSDFNLINISNPASFSSFSRHMPIFEIDGASQFLTLSSTSGEGNVQATTFKKLAIGIPVNDRIGFSIGLLPYTTTGYDIVSSNEDANFGVVDYTYKGNGGLNRAYLGGGYDLIDKDSIKLSVGVNFSLLFGNIEKSRRVEFPDDLNSLNTLATQTTSNSGVNFEFGLLYNQRVTNKFSYSVGASLSAGGTLNSTRDELFATYTNFSGQEVIRDTLRYNSENEGKITIPLNFKIGAAIKLNQNFEISAQYQLQDWSQFKEDFDQNSSSDTLGSSSSISAGIRYTPSDVFKGGVKYYEKIQYRVGVRYENTPLQFNNTQITEFGTSFGIGLPIKPSSTSKNKFRSLSMINIGMNVGRRGTTDNGLIQENFTNVYFGISIMPQVVNRWFVKRKFD